MEMAGAVKSYDKFVVCVEKTPDEFLKSLQSLMGEAITAFETRATGLRHGIAQWTRFRKSGQIFGLWPI